MQTNDKTQRSERTNTQRIRRESKTLRSIMFIAVVLITAVFAISAGCTGMDNSGTGSGAESGTQVPTQSQLPSATMTPMTTATATATSASPSESSSFILETTYDGNGDEKFSANLMGGIVRVLTFTQDEPTAALVEIRTGNALYVFDNNLTPAAKEEKINSAAKGQSGYSWEQAFFVPQDIPSDFAVTTTGNWSLKVSVPMQINSILPVKYQGIGLFSSPFFQIYSGNCTIHGETKDASKIKFSLVSFDGQIYSIDTPKDLKFESGKTTEFTIPISIEDSNNYLVNVDSDGIWAFSLVSE